MAQKKRQKKENGKGSVGTNYPRRQRTCPFCEGLSDNRQEGIEISYKNSEVLARFVTDRGKIVARGRSGVCSKHQRRLAREVKRARHLAILPFTQQPN